jgi:hypothetical protein
MVNIHYFGCICEIRIWCIKMGIVLGLLRDTSFHIILDTYYVVYNTI